MVLAASLAASIVVLEMIKFGTLNRVDFARQIFLICSALEILISTLRSWM